MQRSVSDSWYALRDFQYINKKGELVKKNLSWLFSLATWAYALPLMIAWENPWMFLAGSGICFVAAAPDFKGADRKWHSIFAEGGITIALIFMFFGGYWPVSACAVAIILPLMFIKAVRNNTFWIEVIAYGAFVAGVIIKNGN